MKGAEGRKVQDYLLDRKTDSDQVVTALLQCWEARPEDGFAVVDLLKIQTFLAAVLPWQWRTLTVGGCCMQSASEVPGSLRL